MRIGRFEGPAILEENTLPSEPILWAMCVFSVVYVTVSAGNGVYAEAAEFQGSVLYLTKSLKAAVALVRMVSAMVAVIMGVWVAIKWKHAGQQAQGELVNYLVMLFFVFGASLFVDAVIAVTVGQFSFLESGALASNEPTWITQEI